MGYQFEHFQEWAYWAYDLNFLSILLRLFLALLAGGIIGLERGASRHPAGFRTHILVCMGAAIVMMTNQYIVEVLGDSSDVARMGAQVVTGVGFLGAGTILMTGRGKIKGLTTAAGLWASACLGLAIGIGFYALAIAATVLIFISLALLPKIEESIYLHSGRIGLYVEVEDLTAFRAFMRELEERKLKVGDTDYSNANALTKDGLSFRISLHLGRKTDRMQLLEELAALPGVLLLDEE